MIHFFEGENDGFYITEYGHSVVEKTRVIGPRVRNGYLLHIVISDVCRFSEFDVTGGEALLIAKNKKHDFTVNARYEHFWFCFDGDNVTKLLSVFDIADNRHIHFYISDFERVKDILFTTFAELHKTKSEVAAKSALLSVLPYMREKDGVGRTDVMRAKLFIERNYRHKISMCDVAKHIAISEKHLCRKFKREFGIPPQKYLINVRMERANELLRSGEMTVGEVADSVGYDSPLTFSQMYKRHFGIPPRDVTRK